MSTWLISRALIQHASPWATRKLVGADTYFRSDSGSYRRILAIPSQKQIAANRANAKRSTGPRTELGKAGSRRNACKHGLTAATIVIDGEEPDQFDMLRADLEAEFEPRAGMERELVERLAGLMWRLRRIPAFEAALLENRCAQNAQHRHCLGEALCDDARFGDTLGKLSRHEAGLMNAYSKTLHMLLLVQSGRADQGNTRIVKAIAAPDAAPQ